MGPEWILASRQPREVAVREGGRVRGQERWPVARGSGQSVVCVWACACVLSPSSRSEFQEQSAFVVVIDRIVEGGGKSQRGPLEGQGFVESARKLE